MTMQRSKGFFVRVHLKEWTLHYCIASITEVSVRLGNQLQRKKTFERKRGNSTLCSILRTTRILYTREVKFSGNTFACIYSNALRTGKRLKKRMI